MGKAKKFKQERKVAREEEAQQKLVRREKVKGGAIYTVVGIISIVVTIFVYSSYVAPNINKAADTAGEESEVSTEKSKYSTGDKAYSQAPEMVIDEAKKYTASFETSEGNFKIELFADKAPKTVNNFVVLARDGFYNDLVFHRIIQDFMIQGGDPNGDGTGDPGYKFEDEQNDVQLVRGVLAMANSGPDTNGSQFFIITKENTDWLQGKHTAFGKVVEGLDEVVMKLDKVETELGDAPTEPVIITKVTIEEA